MSVLMSDPASLPPWHRVLPKPVSYDEYPPPHPAATSNTPASDDQIHDQQLRNQEPSPASAYRRNSSFFPLPSATYSQHPYHHHHQQQQQQQQRHPSQYDHQSQSDASTRSGLADVGRRATLATIPYSSLSASDQSTLSPPPHPGSNPTNPLLHLSAVASAEQRRNQEAAAIGERGSARGSGSSSSLSPTAPAIGATRRPYLPPSISESSLLHRLPSDSGSGEAESTASVAGRKRSASLMAGIDEVGPYDAGSRDVSPIHPQQRESIGRTQSMSSIGGTGVGGGPPPQFCLCRTDPKIPRPRNAFILYRQHYQSAVVAQNPGLANPEISKIIGKQWSELPQGVKDEWKSLAEEEKARHQQQYPDYRYQPRRYGRNSTSAAAGSSGDSPSSADRSVAAPATSPTGNCLRCGGKVMNPPSTPDTPFSATTATPIAGPQQQQHHHHPHLPHQQQPHPMQGGMPPGAMPLRTYSQRMAGPTPSARGFGATTSPPMPQRVRTIDEYSAPIPQYHSRDHYAAAPPMSPESKRRRYNGSGVYIPPRSAGEGIAVRGGPDTPHPYYPGTPRRGSLPRPDAMLPRAPPPSTAMAMGPPQRGFRPPVSAHAADPSLTLPPLQTGTPKTGTPTTATDTSGVEAMIMSVPPINKIKLLSKVAPPLAAPKPGSPVPEVRGAIIAVEGVDEVKVKAMFDFLANFLGKGDGHFCVKGFKGPNLDVLKIGDNAEAYLRYLDTVRETHLKSKDLAKWVTTRVEVRKEVGENEEEKDEEQEKQTSTGGDVAMEGGPEAPEAPPTSDKAPAAVEEDPSVSPRTVTKVLPTITTYPVPIAMVRQYQLSTVDTAAAAIPINDSYAPLDHWQWTAALMRGCVGPDITIVIREEENAGGSAQGNGGTNVEIRLVDAKSVVVTEAKKAPGAPAEGIDDKALRRVGFEVDEYLRK